MAVGCGSGGGFGMGLLNPSDSQASVVRAGWWWRAGLLKSKVFRGRPVFRRYSAFLTLMYPIPLPALQNAAGGWFPCVLGALLGVRLFVFCLFLLNGCLDSRARALIKECIKD